MVYNATRLARLGDDVGEIVQVAPGIARIAPGSLPADEETALLVTLSYIDAGTKPTGPLAKKWGTQFQNRPRAGETASDLPGASGKASPYVEYRVAPPTGVKGAGEYRVVANTQTGEVYFTWTHYGDSADPAFVQIR